MISFPLTFPHTRPCFNNHLGMWMIEPGWMEAALAQIKMGKFPEVKSQSSSKEQKAPYQVTSSGIAGISLSGALMKGESKFGCSTVEARQSIRAALNDKDVSQILLVIESPGGTVAGTQELANDVKQADKIKPVHTHFSDMGASAAYWIGSAGRSITANDTALIGSIGTVAVIEDSSKAADMAGIKVHVVSSGAFKGAGAGGTPITDSYLTEVKDKVLGMNEFFLNAVQDNRKMDRKAVDAIADGRIWLAAEAKKLGLIDSVMSLTDLIFDLSSKSPNKAKAQQTRSSLAEMSLRLTKAKE